MAKNYVNFLSYNSTGLNEAKFKWIRDLIKTTDSSFIGIQEHFRKNKTTEDLFVNNFSGNKCYIVPGHRDEGQTRGRPKGGLAQLVSDKLDLKIKHVKEESFRIQGKVIEFPATKLLWLNVYFPTDPLTIEFEETELMEVLSDIEKIMNNEDYDDIIIGGDLNWDSSRRSGFSMVMRDFTQRVGIQSVWEKYPISFTHIHTDLKSTSILDNFLVNERLLNYIEDAGVIHLGDNLSRHSPVMLKLKIGDIPLKPMRKEITRPRRPDWFKATTEDVDEYTMIVENKLSQLICPESLLCSDVHCSDEQHRLDRDGHVVDVLTSVVEASHSAIPLTKKARAKGSSPSIPGWKQQVEPFRQDAMFWHSIWLSLNKPNSGQLFRLMQWTRNKYHYSVRKLKKQSENILAKKLVEASENSEIDLLNEMKNIRGKGRRGQVMPERIEGESDPDEILDKFKAVYKELYNSAESIQAMTVIKDKLRETIGEDDLNEVNKVTGRVVKEACTKMKPGKLDVSGGFSSDVLLHGPDSLFDHLALIFRSFLVHGEVTAQLLCCAFLPLFKGGHKDSSKTDSYRAIAGSSQILKLFDNVVLLLWGHLLSSDSLQFGYKCGTSTTQCSWLVKEVADYYLQRGTPIIGVTLDCSKAFDKCLFSKLFEKLHERHVPAIVIRTLIHVYEEQTACVKLLDKKSETFTVTNGTRQGSVLSPSLFAVYIDGLLQELRDLKVGCHIGGWWVGATCFADDLFLLAPSRSAAQLMLNTCEKYAMEHNLEYSTDPNPSKSKSKCLYFTGKARNVQYPDPLRLFGADLPWVVSAEHLGHTLHQDCTMDLDAKIKRARFIEKTCELRDTFEFAHPEQIMKAAQIYASDAYGAMLYDLSSSATESFFKSWKTFVKLAWKVPRNTYTYLVDNLLATNFSSLQKQVMSRYVTFFQSLFTSTSREVRHVARVVSHDARSTVFKNVQYIKTISGFSPWDYGKMKIAENVAKVDVPDNNEWRLSLLEKMLRFRMEMETKMEDTAAITKMIDSLCTT